MALNSYFDFAENDFQYFKASYDAGIVANMMGAMAQGICEKYMKHLISEYYKPDDATQQKDFENILRTHSLNRLMKFLKGNMGAEFSKNTQTHMRMIDGFYFSTRYPGAVSSKKCLKMEIYIQNTVAGTTRCRWRIL